MYVCDRQGHCLYVTPASAEVLGRQPGEMIGKSWRDLGLPRALCVSLSRYAAEAMATGRPIREMLEVSVGSSGARYVACHVDPVPYGEDGAKVVVVELRDPNRQAEVVRDLELARTVTECVPVGMATVRIPDWYVLYANDACRAMFSERVEDITGHRLVGRFERPGDPTRLMRLLMDCEEFRNMEVPLVHQNGERVWTLVSGRLAAQRSGSAAVLVFNKISERQQLRELASYDPLTGLPNRNHLWEQLGLAIRRASRGGHLVGVLFVDLDGFKQVNDSYGHQSGDHLLRTLARRISRSVRGYDTVARMGGDEFVVVLERLNERAQAEQVAKHIMRTLSEPVELGGNGVLTISASIGIAIYPTDGDTSEELIQQSDIAMYQAKRSGPGRIQLNPPNNACGYCA